MDDVEVNYFNGVPDTEQVEPDGANANDRKRNSFISIGDLLDEEIEETPSVVEGLLGVGNIMLLSAKPKVGKSVLAQNLALEVARGGTFLGRRCMQGPVLYVAMEEPRRTVKDRMRALGAARDTPLHFHIGRVPAGAMEWLLENVEAHKPILVVIDTFIKFTQIEDIERYGTVSNAVNPLLSLARERGIAQVWLHHNNKSGDTTNSPSGSNAIVASVDTTIIMKRFPDGTRSAYSEQRIGEDMEETVLAMDPETYEITAAGSRALVEQRGVEEAILELLHEPLQREDIVKLPGVRLTLARQATASLIEAKKIVHTSGIGRKGDPKLYARAADVRDVESQGFQNSTSAGPIKGRDIELGLLDAASEDGTHEDVPDVPDTADVPDVPDIADVPDTAPLCMTYRGSYVEPCTRCGVPFEVHPRHPNRFENGAARA